MIWSVGKLDVDKALHGWLPVGLAVALLLYCGFQGVLIHELGLAWLMFVGAIIEVDIGIVQLHIRWV